MTLITTRTILTPIAAGLLLASTSVMAQQTDVEKGWYVQADAGQAKSYGQEDIFNTDKLSYKRRAWKASTGYRFNNKIALALNYTDLGVVEDYDSRSALESIGGRAYGASAIYNIPFSNSVNAHVKFGLAHFSGRKNRLIDGIGGGSLTVSPAPGYAPGEYTGQHATNDSSDNGAFYGVGMSFDVLKNTSLMVEWERYDFDTVTDVVSAGLRYTFGAIPAPVAVVAPVIIAAPAPVVKPASVPAPVVVLKPLQVNVYFDNDSSALTTEALDILANAQRELDSDRVESINVSGFASAVGNADYNQALSERRAAVVVKHIKANWNLNNSDVKVVSHGEESLINDDIANNSRDRRVMVKISFN